MYQKREIIHETIIRDIMDVLVDVKNTDFSKLSNTKSIRSLSSASSGMVMVFPILASSSLQLKNAQLVSKAQERNVTSMLRMVFSAQQFSDKDDITEYLKRFHSNLRLSSDITPDSLMDMIDTHFVSESTIHADGSEDEIEIKYLQEDYDIPDNINEAIIANFKLVNLPNGKYRVVQEKDGDDADYTGFRGAVDPGVIDSYQASRAATAKSSYIDTSNIDPEFLTRVNNNLTKFKKNDKSDEFTKSRQDGLAVQKDIEKAAATAEDKEMTKFIGSADKIAKSNNDVFRKGMIDSDVKKANELVPTQIIINIHVQYGNDVKTISAIVGIKAKLHVIDSINIIDRIYNKNEDKKFFFKLVQVSSNEISFFRDFVFAIDKSKIDAMGSKFGDIKLFKILERRALVSKIKRALRLQNNAMPISTLVVSQAEVEFLKSKYDIDVEKPKVIRPIMEAYNLLSFVIVDEVNEVAKFLDDTGEDLYQYISFDSLEREASDNNSKKILNLLSKM